MVAPDTSEKLLLQAAQRLFAQKGLDGVSVREIADAANVHFGLIRYHFGNKEGLYRACIEAYGHARLLSAKRFLDPPTSKDHFIRNLKYAIEDIVEIQLENPELTRLVLREVENEDSIADDIFGKTLIQMAKCFVVFFNGAKQAGYLRQDVDPLFITNIIQGSINHFVRTDAMRSRHFKLSLKTPEVRRQLIDQIHGLVLHGIMAKE
jgi:TetR/AcrR family transcriptional regulator